jgi:hypothetical protein
MGIDAVMFMTEIPPAAATDGALLEKSWQLVTSIGAHRFHFCRGDADAPFERQRIPKPALQRVRHGQPASNDPEDIGDGPLSETPGACTVEVNLSGRYFGPGYERGDLLEYCAIAEWLEVHFPGCRVWYGGGDSGGLQPWPEETRREFRNHLYSTKGRDYFNHSSMG